MCTCVRAAGSAPTISIQVEPSDTTYSMFTSASVVHYTSKFSALSSLQTSSASHIEPSQLPPGSRASPVGPVGGAIAALLILAVLAAAGITILIVVLVRRRNVQKSAVLSNQTKLRFNQGYITHTAKTYLYTAAFYITFYSEQRGK